MSEETPPGAQGATAGLLSRFSLRDQAVDVLREMVASGALGSGSRINEAELAARLGISRGPLREAIQRLGAEGFVEFRQNRGAFVRTITLDDLRHMYEVRELIEVKAATLAAARATDADITDLQNRLRAVGDILSNDAAGAYPTEFDLHERVLALSGNPYLHRAGTDLQNRVRLVRIKSGSSPERARQALTEHDQIITAIARRDTRQAARAMTAHLRNSLQHLIENGDMVAGARQALRAHVLAAVDQDRHAGDVV
jgi:DNA-binding GntR family transcriptional regulator